MYVPLRNHGFHSLMTGVDAPRALLERARDLGLPALALTDTDGTAGWVDLLRAADALAAEGAAVRPILGAELSDPRGEGRLVALVAEERGLASLNRLVSERRLGFDPGAHGAGEGRSPEDFDLVRAAARHREGLLYLVDHPRLCLGLMGRVPAEQVLVAISPASVRADHGRASERVRRGEARNTHLARQDGRPRGRGAGAAPVDPRRAETHDAPPPPEPGEAVEDPKTAPPARPVPAGELLDAARATGLGVVAVPDVYHALPGGADDHRLRVAIKHNALLDDLPPEWLAPRDAHLPAAREMDALYAGLEDVPGPWGREPGRDGAPAMVARTLEVAARCTFRPRLDRVHFPEVELPPGESPYSRLCELAFEGAQRRYRPLRPEVVRRLDHELGTIDGLGFAPYFLLVHRIAEYARAEGIPCVGRGSAADSLVAYCLGLTDADPFRYELIFERFLNPSRRDRPDIDLDFCWRRRDQVIEHVYELFGAERTALISTLNTCGLRAAFRETALACGFPPAVVNRWSKVLPHHAPSEAAGAFDGAGGGAPAAHGGGDLGEARELRSNAGLRAHGRRLGGAAPADGPAPGGGGPGGASLAAEGAPRLEAREFTSDAEAPREHPRRLARGEARAHLAHAPAADVGPGEPARSEPTVSGEDGGDRGPTRRGPAPPDDPTLDGEVARALRSAPEARDFPFDDGRWRRVLRLADGLVGTPRHFGLHPGGVVVAPGPITDLVACQRATKGLVVTQLDKDGVEAVGLVKMDLLGNRALTVLDDAVRELAAAGVEVDLQGIAEDDPATGDALAEGRSLGCFQVESPGMRHLLQQTGARDMDAVIQAVALIRPGPAGCGMKDAYIRRFRGLEEPTPPHPRLAEVLRDTQGVLLYQEDVMRVARTLAGMDLAEADLLRRALQKRRTEELAPLAERFRRGCAGEGIDADDARRAWELVANFASFGFCKAHAVTYGRIAYRTVWMKTHHPAVYLCAFLNSDTGYYRTRVYVEEARRLGVAILPPDVNRSATDFRVEWLDAGGGRRAPALRVGLGRVKGLTGALLARLVAGRERGGPYLSLPDLLERARPRRDEAERLIQCGALDGFDRTRPELLWRLHLLSGEARRVPRECSLGGPKGLDPGQLEACRSTPAGRERVEAARAGTAGWRGGIGLGRARLGPGETASLFAPPPTPALVLPGLPDLSRRERGALEYELLGLTVQDHPTRLFPAPADERIARAFPHLVPDAAGDRRARGLGGGGPVNPVRCAEVRELPGGRVTLRGWLVASRRVHTRDDRWMRFLTLEDESGLAEVVLWPDVYARDGHRLAEPGSLVVTGTIQDQLGARTLEADRIW